MNSDEFKSRLRRKMLAGEVILFLGAGASLTSTNKSGEKICLGNALKDKISEKFHLSTTETDTLGDIYNIAKKRSTSDLYNILSGEFRDTSPSHEYISLREYSWKRIYTTNIDDSFENTEKSLNVPAQKLIKIHGSDRITNKESLENLYFVKLNGDIQQTNKGFIFSPEEYGAASASFLNWYEELGRDFLNYDFIFIGTQINEPVFFHTIEYYKNRVTHTDTKAYLICPNISEVKKESLETSNIEVIDAKLSDFTTILSQIFPHGLNPSDILHAKNPWLSITNPEKYNLSAIKDILPVTNDTLKIPTSTDNSQRDFYKGFKPTWKDIVEKIPAELSFYTKALSSISLLTKENSIVLTGPAGSGKTTTLKQMAWRLRESHSVYYIDYTSSLLDSFKFLNDLEPGKKKIIFIERISIHIDEFIEARDRKLTSDFLIVTAEREGIWNSRIKEHFPEKSTKTFETNTITKEDAKLIIKKLEKYGNFTRLKKLKESQQSKELHQKSNGQLLIGLLEATYGRGYEKIIKDEYRNLDSDEKRALVFLTAIGTANNVPSSVNTVQIALSSLGYSDNIDEYEEQMKGILTKSADTLSLRHPVYAEKVIYNSASTAEKHELIKGYLEAFSKYEKPTISNLNKNNKTIFKSIINANYLYKLLDGKRREILDIY
ncbi:SIR2 family protein, partial [Pseudomonas aeruginosa]